MVRLRRFLSVLAAIALLSALAVIVPVQPALADDASLGRVGEAVRPIGNSAVTMVGEDIRIEAARFTSRVRCRFTFRNDGDAASVLMGFPELPQPEESIGGDNTIHGFAATVDGSPLKVTRLSGVTAPSGAEDLPGGSDQLPDYPFWWTFQVGFAAGQERVVENTYEVHNLFWSNDETQVGYTLVSGRTWRGTIGRIDVTVVPKGWSVADLTAAKPGDYAVDAAGDIIWHRTDVDPHDDIVLRFNARQLDSTQPVAARTLRQRAIECAATGTPGGPPSPGLLELLAEADSRAKDALSDKTGDYYLEADVAVARFIAALAGRPSSAGRAGPPVIGPVEFALPPEDIARDRFNGPGWDMTLSLSDAGEDLACYAVSVWYLDDTRQRVLVFNQARRDGWLNPRGFVERALFGVPAGLERVFYRALAQDFAGQTADTGEVGLYVQPDGTLAASPPSAGRRSGLAIAIGAVALGAAAALWVLRSRSRQA